MFEQIKHKQEIDELNEKLKKIESKIFILEKIIKNNQKKNSDKKDISQ